LFKWKTPIRESYTENSTIKIQDDRGYFDDEFGITTSPAGKEGRNGFTAECHAALGEVATTGSSGELVGKCHAPLETPLS
jgi:hypothetical protein